MSENEAGAEPQVPEPDALDSLAEKLLALCDDEWLRRRDRYMGMSERPLRDSGASAMEHCAHQVRALLRDLGYEYRNRDPYWDWVLAGRPVVTQPQSAGDPR